MVENRSQPALDAGLPLAGLREGRPEAIDAWFRAEHPRVFRLCVGFLADAAEADDLAQEAMLHLLDKISTWDPGRPYGTWRTTLVLNLCRDRLRRVEARSRAEASASRARLPDRLPDPASRLQAQDVRAVLERSLAGLTPREREVFVLRDLEGLATGDVARQLDLAEGSVRSLLTLARRRLRGLLAERLPGLAPGAGKGG